MSPTADAKSLFESALASARDIAFVASIFLIFTGIVFRYRYFDSFNVPSSAAEGSLYLILVDAYEVLFRNPSPVLVLAIGSLLVVLGTSFIARHLKLAAPVSRGLVSAVSACLVIVSFPILDQTAERAATEQSTEVRAGHAIGAGVYIVKAHLGDIPQAQNLLDSSRVSIIAQTDRDLFVLYQPPPNPRFRNVVPDAEVVQIPRDAVAYIESDLVASVEK